MSTSLLHLAIEKLARQFETLPWEYNIVTRDGNDEIVRLWPGDPEEGIMVAVLKGSEFREKLHRQDYYFFNYAYEQSYDTISDKRDNVVTLHEGECYVGQPFCGYGIQYSGDNPAIVVGVLIQKELFYRDFLPIVSTDPSMLRFFIEPHDDEFSTGYLRFAFPKDSPVRSILELMIMEYADRQEDTQEVLKSLTGTLILHIARRYRLIASDYTESSTADKIMGYMAKHLEKVTLADIGKEFSYHPTYISNLLKKDTGSTFSEILLKLRMERALMLMKGTKLSNEEIAAMSGYNDSSNFYKAFKEYYGVAPREYLK